MSSNARIRVGGRRGALARLLIVSLAVLAWLAIPGATRAHAATQPVTVSLYRVHEIHCDEGAAVPCPNDYYPVFKVDGKGCTNDDCDPGFPNDKNDFCCAHPDGTTGDIPQTNWTRTFTVDTTHNPVDIHMELWDQDDSSQDDVIHWVKNQDYLDLKFDLNTCTFTGSGLTAAEGAGVPGLAGQSETDGVDSARGYFTITTPACIAKSRTTDSDGDGILDSQESPGGGVDANGDGTPELKLFDDFGALPYHKDLFVEEDYMAGDKPQAGVIDDVKKVFAESPVDGGKGVTLHVDEGSADQVPNVPNLLFQSNGPGAQDDFNDLKHGTPDTVPPAPPNPAVDCDGFWGTAAERASTNCVNILAAKRQVFRYMIFGDSYQETPGSSGISEWQAAGAPVTNGPMGGNDFMVTIAGMKPLAISNAGGRKVAEESTFLHEFGHTLSLGHGGRDAINCKPNYLSVMNYTLQFPTLDPARPLDYTSTAKGTALGLSPGTLLDETNLNENNGVFGTPNPARNSVWGWFGINATGPATNGPMDWNQLNGPNETGLKGKQSDINYIASIGPSSSNGGCNTSSQGQKLQGYDDWASLQYDPKIDVADFADGARPNVPTEMTDNTLLAMLQKADVNIAKTADQAEAQAGDTVSYTTTVGNRGPGPGQAKDIKVTDTLPDGTKVDRTPPDLDKGATEQVTPKFTYLVPCTATNGSVLTNNVTVTANDKDGVPDPFTDDNTASATTKVLAPVLTLAETATPTVDAGDPITYTLTYENTGGAAASNVAITDTLPAGVYYSKALDTGAGPQPSTISRNPDGTTTLTWTVASLGASTGAKTIQFTARPGLLSLPGDTVTSAAKLSFSNANGCTFAPLSRSATTTISAAPVLGDARSRGHWNSHPADWTADLLARIQATDQRFDELDPFGLLTAPEVGNALGGDSQLDNVLRAELLTMYLNLAGRHIGAGTLTDDTRSQRLGLQTVRDVALFAQATLDLPLTGNEERYKDAIHVVSATHGGDSTTGTTTGTNPVGVGGDLGTLPKPQVDTDHDGVADSRDACPTAAGTQNGCPARLFARLSPARVALRARRIAGRSAVTIASGGWVVPPAGVKADQACRNGHVTVVVKAGSLTVSRRAVRLGADCAYKAVVRIANARVAGRVVSVRAYFTGNDVLKRRTSHLRLAH